MLIELNRAASLFQDLWAWQLAQQVVRLATFLTKLLKLEPLWVMVCKSKTLLLLELQREIQCCKEPEHRSEI